MILACSHIYKSFGTEPVIADGSFHIEEREKAAIVGINGAGKSTLLKIIMGLEPCDSGEVILAKGKTIGYLAQHQDVLGEHTIYEALMEVKKDVLQLEQRIRQLEQQMKQAGEDELSALMEAYTKSSQEFEQKNGYACQSEITGVLKGLGFTEEEFSKKISSLSGGQQGYGYNVEYLYKEISKILGLDQIQNMIIIGGGNIGQALAKFSNFQKRGFVTIGIFDNDPNIIGKKINDVPVMDIRELENFAGQHDVRIAVLTVPKSAAPQIADRVAACGIRAIWNFAHIDLHISDQVVIENVHLSDSLMQLSYRLSTLSDADS